MQTRGYADGNADMIRTKNNMLPPLVGDIILLNMFATKNEELCLTRMHL